MKTQQASNHSNAKGFTIVETILVLGIAGLILLIVFLALPGLTRSSRNNQRHQDVTLVLQAVSHYELNESGSFPQPCGGSANSCQNASIGVNATPNDYFLRFTPSKHFAFYSPNAVYINPNKAPALYSGPVLSHGGQVTDQVDVYNYEKCDPNTPGNATPTGAGYNDVVALYAIEVSNNVNYQCQQL